MQISPRPDKSTLIPRLPYRATLIVLREWSRLTPPRKTPPPLLQGRRGGKRRLRIIGFFSCCRLSKRVNSSLITNFFLPPGATPSPFSFFFFISAFHYYLMFRISVDFSFHSPLPSLNLTLTNAANPFSLSREWQWIRYRAFHPGGQSPIEPPKISLSIIVFTTRMKIRRRARLLLRQEIRFRLRNTTQTQKKKKPNLKAYSSVVWRP